MAIIPNGWVFVEWVELKTLPGLLNYIGRSSSESEWVPFKIYGEVVYYTQLIKTYFNTTGDDVKDFYDNFKPEIDNRDTDSTDTDANLVDGILLRNTTLQGLDGPLVDSFDSIVDTIPASSNPLLTIGPIYAQDPNDVIVPLETTVVGGKNRLLVDTLCCEGEDTFTCIHKTKKGTFNAGDIVIPEQTKYTVPSNKKLFIKSYSGSSLNPINVELIKFKPSELNFIDDFNQDITGWSTLDDAVLTHHTGANTTEGSGSMQVTYNTGVQSNLYNGNWESGDFFSGSEQTIGPRIVGYWKMNETSGSTAADSSTNGNDASLYNGAHFTTTGRVGLGNSLQTDGDNDYARINHITAYELSEFTVVCDFEMLSVHYTDTLFSKAESGYNKGDLDVDIINSTGRCVDLKVRLQDGSSNVVSFYADDILREQRKHRLKIYVGSNKCKIELDGKIIYNNTSTGFTDGWSLNHNRIFLAASNAGSSGGSGTPSGYYANVRIHEFYITDDDDTGKDEHQWISESTNKGQWRVSNTGPAKFGSYYAIAEGREGSSLQDSTLETKGIDLSSLSSGDMAKLKFHYLGFKLTGSEYLKVELLNSTGSWITVDTLTGSVNKNPGTQSLSDWIPRIIDITDTQFFHSGFKFRFNARVVQEAFNGCIKGGIAVDSENVILCSTGDNDILICNEFIRPDLSEWKQICFDLISDNFSGARDVSLTLTGASTGDFKEYTSTVSSDATNNYTFDINTPSNEGGELGLDEVKRVCFSFTDTVSNSGDMYFDNLKVKDQIEVLHRFVCKCHQMDIDRCISYDAGEIVGIKLENEGDGSATYKSNWLGELHNE